MNPTGQLASHAARQRWRRLSLLFLSLLPILALFHLIMWFGFTRTLFRPETGGSKRLGYLVSLEDRMGALQAQEPKTGFTILDRKAMGRAEQVPIVIFGDSFGAHLAKACSLKWHESVGMVPVYWNRNNGLAQIKAWLKDDWFRTHGVKTVVIERVECEWLDSFADEGDPTRNIPLAQELNGELPAMYEKAPAWTFANNGNFKVVFCNFAYLFSPTAFNMTDTVVVPLKKKFFDCSYGNELLFYRGDLLRGVYNTKNVPRFEQALIHLHEIADLCHQQGIKFCLVVPPGKSYLYYDWVVQPFYPYSPMLEKLQERATPDGYVDLKKLFHQQLENGYQDLYYPDDLHWNYPAAEMAADELTKAGAGP